MDKNEFTTYFITETGSDPFARQEIIKLNGENGYINISMLAGCNGILITGYYIVAEIYVKHKDKLLFPLLHKFYSFEIKNNADINNISEKILNCINKYQIEYNICIDNLHTKDTQKLQETIINNINNYINKRVCIMQNQNQNQNKNK